MRTAIISEFFPLNFLFLSIESLDSLPATSIFSGETFQSFFIRLLLILVTSVILLPVTHALYMWSFAREQPLNSNSCIPCDICFMTFLVLIFRPSYDPLSRHKSRNILD